MAHGPKDDTMQAREFEHFSSKLFDLIVIGGGITGSSILWDATLRKMDTLLVEKSDFSSATSQATSKLLHGGLRYLKQFQFKTVIESLSEKKILAKISPHS